VLGSGPAQTSELDAALARLAELGTTLTTTEAKLSTTKVALAKVTEERNALRRVYQLLLEQHELLRRRIYMASAERIDVTQLELEFKKNAEALTEVGSALADADAAELTATGDAPAEPPPPPPPPAAKLPRAKSTGRRNLAVEDLPEDRIELLDPEREGTSERLFFEESFRLGYRRAGAVRLVVARAVYKDSETQEITTVDKPKEILERGLLAPSMIAHLLVSKYRFGIPFHRLTEMFRAEGIRLDDGLMCRYAEHVGATLGCIVLAMAKEAKETAFCLSTDATGVCIQPLPRTDGKRQACAKGHFFVVLADQDHIFFEYQPKHTSAAVCGMFRGFSGYIQADASAVYDALYRGEARTTSEEVPPKEVGCWAHARRRFWEAAVVAKDAAAREALLRMHVLFELEEQWQRLAPAQRHARRQLRSRRLVDDFFAWAKAQYARVKDARGLVATAFGYAVRQEPGLRSFLDDGRLPMTNNHSERALRFICGGRKAWLFFGSDDHATAAANLFSLIASCKLHDIDAETYLAEIINLLPYWPRERYLELAPKYWRATRARLRPDELAREIGPVTIPPLEASAAE
jgi:transposase